MKRWKRVSVLLTVLLLCFGMTAHAGRLITSKEQLNEPGTQVCVGIGSAAETIVAKELPNAQLQYFGEITASYESVVQGRADAFIYDRRSLEMALEGGMTGVYLLDETMEEQVRVAVGISPVSKIPDLEGKLNTFIAELKADGTLDDMYRRWVVEGDEEMPDIALPEHPDCKLKVATAGTAPPYTYYKSTELNGYDIELAKRFALWLNAELSFHVCDFGSIIAAAASGEADCIMSDLNITPEREEALTFSDPLYTEALAIMVKGDAPASGTSEAAPQDASSDDEALTAQLQALDGKRFGVQTGSTFDRDVLSWFPHAQLFYYNSLPDLAVALNTGKIDAFPTDSISLEMMGEQGTKLRALDRFMDEYSCGFVFDKTPEGEALRDEFDDWMDRSRESGALDEKLEKWIHAPEEEKTMPDYRSLPGEKGVLKFATEAGFPPFDYMREDEVVGYEVEMAIDFCTDRGYGIEIIPMNFDGILPALQSGKIDFAASGFAITQERMESINFSQPYYHGGTKIVVRDNQNTGAMSFLGGIQESFEKTFLREQRWKLFLRGIGSTLLITVSSLLLGTVLGFLVFLLCRRGSALTDRVTRGCLWLVQGMPVVVLLMVLYYLIFANVAIGGTAVSVIGFTILFGASTFGLMKMGVGAVDSGQYEAASALGYTDTRTFFKIILPQALPHVADAYRGEVVGLIKATAVVGYIAVQDLTKMGDLVRSRTYEAFFPLIAVTVIYFLLEGLLDLILKRVARRLDPRARSREDILKGITREE